MKKGMKIKIRSNQVVCGLIIGELDTKKCDYVWLSSDDYDYYTKINAERL